MSKKKKENKEAGFDGRIWPNILDFNARIDEQLTSKANFLFGASTFIMIFIANKILSVEFLKLQVFLQYAWFVLLTGSFFSFLASMMIVLPKIRLFSQKERIKEDIFYYKNVMKFYSRKDYANYLKDLPLDNKRIGLAYANQIYSLATNIIPFKFRLLKISGWVLVVSIILSSVLFVTSLFY